LVSALLSCEETGGVGFVTDDNNDFRIWNHSTIYCIAQREHVRAAT
jgi:hypothetical protein